MEQSKASPGLWCQNYFNVISRPLRPRLRLQFLFLVLCNIFGLFMAWGALQWCCSPHSGISPEFRQLRPSPTCSNGLQSAEHDERIKPNTSEASGSIKHIPSSFCHPRSAVESKNKFGRVKMIIGVFGSSHPVKRLSPLPPQNTQYGEACANITDPHFPGTFRGLIFIKWSWKSSFHFSGMTGDNTSLVVFWGFRQCPKIKHSIFWNTSRLLLLLYSLKIKSSTENKF